MNIRCIIQRYIPLWQATGRANGHECVQTHTSGLLYSVCHKTYIIHLIYSRNLDFLQPLQPNHYTVSLSLSLSLSLAESLLMENNAVHITQSAYSSYNFSLYLKFIYVFLNVIC
jgi:hypothetical protein